MSRNKKEANKSIFEALDSFCAALNQPISNSGKPRWINANGKTDFLESAILVDLWRISSRASLALFEYGNVSFLVSVGLRSPTAPIGFIEESLVAEQLTAALFELKPIPLASADEIRNSVEVSDFAADGASYVGHDADQIKALFPSIAIASAADFPTDDCWRAFFSRCICELEFGGYWPSAGLLSALHCLTELDSLKIPYNTLCRSIFDTDQSSLYLALYRCLENLYAYHSAKKIAATFSLSQDWQFVAAELESKLGWRPKEETSLSTLLAYSDMSDLRQIHALLAPAGSPTPSDETLVDKATKAIYRLRNNIVHYRSTSNNATLSEAPWDEACSLMVHIVFSTYTQMLSSS